MNPRPINRSDDHESDNALIKAAQQANRPALEELLARHQDRVYRTAYSYLGGNHDAASEVAQQALLTVAQRLDQFRGESRFTTWLHRITINAAKNHQIAKNRQERRFTSLDAPYGNELDEVPAAHPDLRPIPSEQAALSETMQALHHHIGQLPEEYRKVLVLRFIDDASYEEIADTLALPLGTVKSRINRGRIELRKLMEPWLGQEGATPQ